MTTTRPASLAFFPSSDETRRHGNRNEARRPTTRETETTNETGRDNEHRIG